MANIFRQATSWLYTLIAATILGSWSLLIIILVGLTAVNQNPGLLELIALPSLMTFLVAKFIMTFSAPATTTPAAPRRDLATWIATADHGSPHGALALFLFSVTWLLHLARVVFAMFVLVIMGVFFLLASSLNAADNEETSTGGKGFFDDAGERDNFTTALVEFEEHVGFAFGDYIKANPWLLFQVVTGLWAVSATLVMYILAYGLSALRQVLTTPLEAWARGDAAAPDVRQPAVAAAVPQPTVAAAVQQDKVATAIAVEAAN